MELMNVSATLRTDTGKGAARRSRSESLIPAVLYGREQDAVSLTVSPKEVKEILLGAFGRNSVIELDVEGRGKELVLICDYQYHPVSRELLHVDFLRISEDATVDVEVPFSTTGKAPGIVMGGTLQVVFRTLPVRCLPKSIPESLVHDIGKLDLEDTVSAGELALPEGVELRLPEKRTLIQILGSKRKAEAKDEAEAK